MAEDPKDVFNFEDEKNFHDCVIKILNMDNHDLVNLIKNIMVQHKETMQTIKKY